MSHSLQEIINKQKQALEFVEVGQIYCHYKNSNLYYKVIAVAIQEATEEPCIVYQSLYGDKLIWVRGLSSWSSFIEYENKLVQRFQKVELKK